MGVQSQVSNYKSSNWLHVFVIWHPRDHTKKLRDKQARRKPIMIRNFVIDTIMPIHAHITMAYNSPASSVPVNKPRQKLRISLWDFLLGNFLHRSCIFSTFFVTYFVIPTPTTNTGSEVFLLSAILDSYKYYWIYDENSSTKNIIRKLGLQHHSFRVSDEGKQLRSREIRLSRGQYSARSLNFWFCCRVWQYQ